MAVESEKIIIYQHPDFNGASRDITDDTPNIDAVGGFNNVISSIKVIGSVWVAFEDANYNGRQYILEEGAYGSPGDWHGSHDKILSLRKIPAGNEDAPLITLYEHIDYMGTSMNATYAVNNLDWYKFNNKVNSIKVKGGSWVLYDDYEYSGRQYVVFELHGTYDRPEEWKAANDKISSLRPVKEPFRPTEVISMSFDISKAVLDTTPVVLVNLSQTNDTSTEQTASWATKRVLTTTKTYEWFWKNSTSVSVETEFSTGVPFIAKGKVKVGVTNTFDIGEKRGEQNTQSQEWSLTLPATVKPETRLRVQAVIHQGKINVPFKAVLQKGNRRWDEVGTYKGTESFDLHTDYNETPL